jgi:cytochrome b561
MKLNHKTKNVLLKISHWAVFLLFLFLAISSILELTIFHYSTLIPNLEFAYGVNEIQSGKASQVFIAKVIRGELWDLHFYTGVLFAFLLTIQIINRFFRTNSIKKNIFQIGILAITYLLLVTGFLRFNRGSLFFMSEENPFWRHLMQDIHHYSAYLITILVITHVGYMIYLENKKIKGIISNMFTSQNFKLKTLLLSIVILSGNHSIEAKELKYDAAIVITKKIPSLKDKNYMQALEYYEGRKGFIYEERNFPNCPYDACTKDSREVKSFSKDGRTYYTIKIHNFKKAKEYFDKSVEVSKNPLAAERNLIMILERINYKDKIIDDYLLKEISRTLGINNIKEIRNEIYKNIQYLGKKNSVKILFKAAEILEKGYMGIPKNSLKAKKFYKYVLLKAKKDSLYYMLAKSRKN